MGLRVVRACRNATTPDTEVIKPRENNARLIPTRSPDGIGNRPRQSVGKPHEDCHEIGHKWRRYFLVREHSHASDCNGISFTWALTRRILPPPLAWVMNLRRRLSSGSEPSSNNSSSPVTRASKVQIQAEQESALSVHRNAAGKAGFEIKTVLVSRCGLVACQIKITHLIIRVSAIPHPPLGIAEEFPHREFRVGEGILGHLSGFDIEAADGVLTM